jgi:fatty-acid peroxygenase
MKAAVDFLVHSIDYEVPAQDLSVDLSRMPAIPASRFRIPNVRRMH